MTVATGIPDNYQRYLDARHRSAVAFARTAGQSPKPPDTIESLHLDRPRPAQFRFYKQNNLERYEVGHTDRISREGAEAKRLDVSVFDGTNWSTVVSDRASIHESKKALNPGFYLGIALDWPNTIIVQPKSRSLHGALREIADAGEASMPESKADTDGRIRLILRRPLTDQSVDKQRELSQFTIWFDERLGMAPVKFDVRKVYESQGKFSDNYPPQWSEGNWEDFKETEPGLWLPRKFTSTMLMSLLFPAQGTDFPKSMDFNKVDLSAFRYESFTALEQKVTIGEVTVNKPLDLALFRQEFPKGIMVNNEITGKVLQVASDTLASEADLKGAIGSRGGRPSQNRFLLLVIVNVLVVAAAIAVVLVRRHLTAKA